MNKLNLEQREQLAELLDSESWLVALGVIDLHVKDLQARVLQYDLSAGPDGLVIEKARAEGALKLFTRISGLKEELKRKQKEKA